MVLAMGMRHEHDEYSHKILTDTVTFTFDLIQS